ncbi:hypothetical protein CIT26_01335 [Mesorhizobium temperatum]|uniref:Uncharacterized protein n=1 Tax=Mesorhizobium temperatum TaxID=241416 RepID=A0A271LY09_9HYPH|nr:hypothetical protein CIT26_01335 [Mesorhizobium temperatum]
MLFRCYSEREAGGRRSSEVLKRISLVLSVAAGTSAGGHIGVKIVTVSPDNNAVGKPAVMGLYLLLDGPTGCAFHALFRHHGENKGYSF